MSVQLNKNNIIFKFINNYFYIFLKWFYSIKIINKHNINTNKNKPTIYIAKHSTHNYELILGLFSLYQHSNMVIRGLGHYSMYWSCPHYAMIGAVIGSKENAELLLENNEQIMILPGGAEEMLRAVVLPNKVDFISKSGKFRTGFAQLSKKYNANIIPIAGTNIEKMVYTPLLDIYKRCLHIDYYKTTSIFEFYIKIFIHVMLTMFIIIPIRCNITLQIGTPLQIKKNETINEYAHRCKNELQELHNIVNKLN